MENRIIELETKLSFQESTIQDLNDIVTGQQNLLHQLTQEIMKLKSQLQNITHGMADEVEEPPPPHY